MTKAILKKATACRVDYNTAAGLAVDIRQEGKERWRHSVVLRDGMPAEVAGAKLIAFGTLILKHLNKEKLDKYSILKHINKEKLND